MSQTKAKKVSGKKATVAPAGLRSTAPKASGKPSSSTDLAIVRGELGKIIIDMLRMKEELSRIGSGVVAANNAIASLAQRMNEKRPDRESANLGEKLDDLKGDIDVLKVLIRQSGGSRSFME